LNSKQWTNDKELLAAAVAGNTLATAEVILLLSDDAIRLAWRMMGTNQDAEDVVQSAFFKLWRNQEFFKGDAKLKTYFYTIVQRECFNALKKNKKHSNLDDLDEISEASYEFSHTDETGQLKSAIHLLPPKQRLAIVMWAYYDKTAEEIGEQLEMNKNAVDQLLFRAKANLKKYFESKEYAR
jgi:RNA polymerase sigma-70 factor (ECF subfamily)